MFADLSSTSHVEHELLPFLARVFELPHLECKTTSMGPTAYQLLSFQSHPNSVIALKWLMLKPTKLFDLITSKIKM